MPGYDGFGNFTRAYNWAADKLALIKITAARMDAEFDVYAVALNQVLLRSGVAAMTGDLAMGGNDVTGVGLGAVGTPSIAANGAPTTGMYFPSTTSIAWSVSGIQRLGANTTGAFVPSGQLFGIGTAAPRTQLDVVGISSFRAAFEDTTISATAITGTVQFDAITQSIVQYTSNAAGNFTFNIRADSGNTLNSIMATGQTLTIAIEVPQGATAYYCTAITIDGAAPASIQWANGGAPTSGNVSGTDVYTIRITKTGAATFRVRAAQNQEK
jgi:hypothetical protein